MEDQTLPTRLVCQDDPVPIHMGFAEVCSPQPQGRDADTIAPAASAAITEMPIGSLRAGEQTLTGF